MSTRVFPNRVDPDTYSDDAVTYWSCSITAIPVTRKLLAVTAFTTLSVSKLPEFAENIVIR